MTRNEPDAAKQWESDWARRLPPDKPWIVRIDGRSFHRWTRGLERPFDEGLREAMAQSAEALVHEAGAEHAFTQSDEITLVLYAHAQREPAFGAKLQKLVSLLAARATMTFNEAIGKANPAHATRAGAALFDARVFAVPSPEAAVRALEARRNDCWRNAVQSVGHWRYGHQAMHRRPISEVARALEADGLAMKEWPVRHTGGVGFERVRVRRAFSTEEIDKLPGRHAARTNPALEVERSEIVRVEGPSYRDIDASVAKIFGWRDAEPRQDTV